MNAYDIMFYLLSQFKCVLVYVKHSNTYCEFVAFQTA